MESREPRSLQFALLHSEPEFEVQGRERHSLEACELRVASRIANAESHPGASWAREVQDVSLEIDEHVGCLRDSEGEAAQGGAFVDAGDQVACLAAALENWKKRAWHGGVGESS